MKKRYKTQFNIFGIVLCIIGILIVSAISLENGAVHVAPIVEYDMTRAKLFFAPVLFIGILLEFFMLKAGKRERAFYSLLVKSLAGTGSCGFVTGVVGHTYPVIDFDFQAIVLAAQILLEFSLIHVLCNPLISLFKSNGTIVPTALETFKINTLNAFEDTANTSANELDILTARNDFLEYRVEQSQALILERERAKLLEEFDTLEARELYLYHKLQNTTDFKDALVS